MVMGKGGVGKTTLPLPSQSNWPAVATTFT